MAVRKPSPNPIPSFFCRGLTTSPKHRIKRCAGGVPSGPQARAFGRKPKFAPCAVFSEKPMQEVGFCAKNRFQWRFRSFLTISQQRDEHLFSSLLGVSLPGASPSPPAARHLSTPWRD